MRIVVDASAILCVVLNQDSKAKIISETTGVTLIAPGSLQWEIGNALSSLVKRKKLTEKDAGTAFEEYAKIPIQFEDVNMKAVLSLVKRHQIYAYDGYMIYCAKNFKVPLLTLDKPMAAIAEKEGVKVLGD
jgi:predicted nucleic acid-binding protein